MQVVIIDDVEINVALMRRLAARLDDVQAVGFTDARAGLEHCIAHAPDLIVTDYMMPDLDGIELVTLLRATSSVAHVPVIMVTANNETDVRYRALEAGVTDFLAKPIDRTEFLARARNMLALSRSQKALADRASWLAGEVEKATAAIVARERETLFCLGRAAEYRDPETGGHILRMAHFSRLIAGRLGLSVAEQDLILMAAPMHDVGKLGIPDRILLKPGRLTDEEMAVMKTHALIGYEILKDSTSQALQAGAVIARAHHEKFDGSGYPAGLTGEAIPLYGRIVAVADVFDALTSERPYKKAWELDRARNFIAEASGQHFDPACVDAFFARWDDVLAVRAQHVDEPAAAMSSDSALERVR
jgi:putative two-component system response regulator